MRIIPGVRCDWPISACRCRAAAWSNRLIPSAPRSSGERSCRRESSSCWSSAMNSGGASVRFRSFPRFPAPWAASAKPPNATPRPARSATSWRGFRPIPGWPSITPSCSSAGFMPASAAGFCSSTPTGLCWRPGCCSRSPLRSRSAGCMAARPGVSTSARWRRCSRSTRRRHHCWAAPPR